MCGVVLYPSLKRVCMLDLRMYDEPNTFAEKCIRDKSWNVLTSRWSLINSSKFETRNLIISPISLAEYYLYPESEY